jgi:3-dehydroquinate synthase
MSHTESPLTASSVRVSLPARASFGYDISIGRGLRYHAGELISAIHMPCRVLLLTDDTVEALYAKEVTLSLTEAGYTVSRHVIPHGEASKSAANLIALLEKMATEHLTRSDLLVALGGGVVGDLGGFGAAVYQRGIPFVQIPTTLLAMVDAAVGGKTGINFNGLKNEVGAFREAEAVVIDTQLLQTLDQENMHSGYAEMLKHALLSDTEMWARHLRFDIDEPDLMALQEMVGESIEVKRRVVLEDPFEHGLRKALNLGHTVGHAFESLAMEKGQPVLHGYAVAWGLLMELYLSARKCGFPAKEMHQMEAYIKEHYGKFLYDCKHYETLYNFMSHDKKNQGGNINFTLLGGIGDIRINQTASQDEIEEMLDYYREN